MATPKPADGYKLISENRRASMRYTVDERIEVGIVLTGAEVKSLRAGKMELGDTYAMVLDGQLTLINAYIAPYKYATGARPEEKRARFAANYVPHPKGGVMLFDDPATSRYRRLTGTDGRVFAAMRAPDGKSLAFISVTKLRRGEKGDLFVDPQAGYLDLTTLETVGPFPISGAFYEVSLGFGPGGALFATESTPGVDGGTFMVDTARTGMAKASAPPAGERTWAQVAQVWHSGKGSPAGATMAADHRSFSLEGGKQITSARDTMSPLAFTWLTRVKKSNSLSGDSMGRYSRAAVLTFRTSWGLSGAVFL